MNRLNEFRQHQRQFMLRRSLQRYNLVLELDFCTE